VPQTEQIELPSVHLDAGFDDLSRRAFQAAAWLDREIRWISTQLQRAVGIPAQTCDTQQR